MNLGMKATNKHKATITLGLVSLGFAVSHLFSHTFVGGVIASGCGAAMVGGLADWFAVSALFRRPLGIPFRTEIIPRNRERISQAIIDMVEQELLTKENIRDTLNHYDLSTLLVDYLGRYGGKNHLKEFAAKIGADVLEKINPAKVGEFLAGLIKDHAGKIPLSPVLAQALAWSVRNGYLDKLVDFVIAELALFIRQPQVKGLLTDFLGEARLAYEKDMHRRRLAGQILERLGVTTTGLAGLLQQKIGDFLAELDDPEHPLRKLLRQKVNEFLDLLAVDPATQAGFEAWKDRFIAGRADLAAFLSGMVEALLAAASDEKGRALFHKWIGVQVDSLVKSFKHNNTQQQVLAEIVRKGLMDLVETHHSQIGTIVRERLSQLSTPALVEFIEGRVGNDLQMIRINGSVVGGLAGIVIFLLTYWWRI